MSKRSAPGLPWWRVASITTLMLGACTALIALVRWLPDSLLGAVAAVLAGVVYTTVLASLLEWLVHRYVYHRKWLPFARRIFEIHHRGHHFVIFPTWRYVTNGPVRRHPILNEGVRTLHSAGWRSHLIKLSHFGFYMTIGLLVVWPPAWLLTHNLAFLTGIMTVSVVFSELFVRVHDAIHYPGIHPFLESQRWFRFLDRHHYIHHVDTEANVNFLLPLADWLLGTMRRTLTLEELALHGPLEEAKARPVGMSEPAREVARPRMARVAAVSDSEPG
jgi:hypothetical protein